MTKDRFHDFPVFQISYQGVRNKRIIEVIKIEAPRDVDNVTIKRLRGGAIQMVCDPQESYHFKGSEERIILTLMPQVLLKLQEALQESSENDNEDDA